MSGDLDVEDIFVQYRFNLFNKYLGYRIRVSIRNRRKRTTTFIGTLLGYDLHVNIVLADAYRVILYYTEDQRQDVDGLLVIRGVNIQAVTLVNHERRLPKWPSKPKNPNMKIKPPVRSQEAKLQVSSIPTAQSKPLKLKRTWLTSGSQELTPSHQTLGTDEELRKPKEENKEGGEDVESKDIRDTSEEKVQVSSTEESSEQSEKHFGTVINQEIRVEEKNDGSISPTFEEFLQTNFDIEEGFTANSEVPESPRSKTLASP